MGQLSKNAMSSFDIRWITEESSPLLDSRLVDNIYQVGSNTLLLNLQGLRERILLEAGRRVHLSAYRQQIPQTPPAFCQALRKHLRRTRLKKMCQIGFDRLVRLEFASAEGDFSLYTEFFGKGNHILVDDRKKILQALTYRISRSRDVVRGETLRLPSTRNNFLEAELSDIMTLRKGEGVIAAELTRAFNIGGLYAEEVALRAGLDGGMPCNLLSREDVEDLYSAIRSLLFDFGTERPHIVLDEDGAYLNVLPFPLRIYDGFEVIPFQSFNRAADEYYTHVKAKDAAARVENRFKQKLGKQERILAEQEDQLKDLKRGIVANQRIGDLVYAHFHQLQAIIDRLMGNRRSGKQWSRVLGDLEDDPNLPNLDSVDTDRGTATVVVEGNRFKLDLRKDVYENASYYYEKAKSSKAKLEGVREAIEETKSRIGNVSREGFEREGESEFEPQKVRQREWYEKFHWFHSSEGYLVLGGRDATTNEILIKRYTDSGDIVLHADIAGSPFAVVKTKGRVPSESTLIEAAQMVASYSKAWRSGGLTVDVYWIKPSQVDQAPPSGEYLPRGSFMIHGSRNYLKNVPLRLAIGVIENSDRLIVIGGPPSAVSTKTSLFEKIVPGRVKTGRLVKAITSKLAKRADDKLASRIEATPLEEFQAFIPGGRGEIES